jgi:hypothetical protein
LTTFIVEHQCPQCGAPADLEESDRFFQCAYCRVSSYLTAPGVMRYILAHKAPTGKPLLYFPYWRFKGMLFYCLPRKMDQRFVDASHQAIACRHFPVSLGFRSQTQKLRFAAGQSDGIFLKPDLSLKDFLQILDDRFRVNLPKPILYQAHIGETLTLLYAPFYKTDGKLYDAVLNKPLSAVESEAIEKLQKQQEQPVWPISFLPTLCPRCGWDLQGIRDSLVLNCTNCRTCWWEKKGKLEELPCAYATGSEPTEHYLPFWRIQADIRHIKLESYADLIKLANLPRVMRPGWERRRFYFWSPAFKVRPQSLLTFATHATLHQPDDHLKKGQPAGIMHGVNMPVSEAVESLKLLLSGMMRPRERMIQTIQDVEITARRVLLVYLPFQEGHHEYIHKKLNLAINRNLLAHSRNL